MFSIAPPDSPPFWGDDDLSVCEPPAAAAQSGDPELEAFVQIFDLEGNQQEVGVWAWRELRLWFRGKAVIDEYDLLRRSHEQSLDVSNRVRIYLKIVRARL
jgi:hypothetical protein